MTKPLVLIDVDWTLLNDLFHFEPNGLKEKIMTMVAAGWQIGLMSDRPQNELMEFSDELGMNGPLLAELGNILIYPQLDICKCWRTYDERSKMSMFTKRAIITLMEKFPDLPILLSSNVRQFREFQNLNWPREKVITAVHTQRRTSLLVNVHRYGPDGLLEVGAEPVQSIARLLKTQFIDDFFTEPFLFVSEKKQGCALFHFADASKARAAKYLFDEKLADSIVMIGDMIWDDLANPRAIQLAVGNADDAYKKICRFTADKPFSTGVGQCLDWLKANYE